MNSLPWQLQVFAMSVRKKEKWLWARPHVQKALQKPNSDPGSELRCLDVGSGVGTLSVLMERLGGNWEFTETDHAAAQETRKIVKGPVHEIDIFDPRLQPITYQLLTIFDVVEHISDPQKFMNRLAELVQPGGTIILTTPADNGGFYFWRRLADKLFGIDKAAHGHVVEGFAHQQLQTLTQNAHLNLIELTPFSFFFTETIELAYNAAYIMKNRAKQTSTPGYNLALSPASGADVADHAWQLKLLQYIYPVLRGISLLDRVLPIPPGYEWGLVARKGEMALP